MSHITDTIVPEADPRMEPMNTVVDPLSLPSLGGVLDDGYSDPLVKGHRTPVETAVDWFFDEVPTDESMEDDLPRLPLATADDDPITLDRFIAPPPSPSKSVAGIAAGLVGLGLLGTILVVGTSAIAAGVAGVWWTSGGDVATFEAPAVTPEAEEAWVDVAIPVYEDDADVEDAAPVTVPAETPARTPAPTPATVEAPAPVALAPEAKPSRPAIVAPVAGTADEAASHSVKLITSPPAARILVDGVDHGRTPLKLDLTEGAHTLVFEIGGVRSTVPVQVAQQDRVCFAAAQGVFATSDCQ